MFRSENTLTLIFVLIVIVLAVYAIVPALAQLLSVFSRLPL